MSHNSAEKTLSHNLDIDLICYLLEECQQKIKSLEQKVQNLEEDRDLRFRNISEKLEYHEQECNTRLDHMDIQWDIQQDDLQMRVKKLELQKYSDIKMTEIEVETNERNAHLINQIETTLKSMNLKVKRTHEAKPLQKKSKWKSKDEGFGVSSSERSEESGDERSGYERVVVIVVVGEDKMKCSEKDDGDSELESSEYLFVEDNIDCIGSDSHLNVN